MGFGGHVIEQRGGLRVWASGGTWSSEAVRGLGVRKRVQGLGIHDVGFRFQGQDAGLRACGPGVT